LLALLEGHFLVCTPSNQPVVIDSSGATVRRWGPGGITGVARFNDLLVLTDGQYVWACDLGLNPLRRLTWPGQTPNIDCFVKGIFYWAESNEVKYCTQDGQSGTFGQLGEGLISGAVERYQQMWPDGTVLVPNFPFCWRLLSFSESQQLFFLANFMPHLVACLDRAGQPLWCECLGPGCCGGAPYSLPNGRYVASGGCNGILSWLDSEGNVLLQSRPHEGVGLATAYTHELHVLSDGRVVADGGPGLVAYSMTGELVWKFGRGYAQSHYDPEKCLLVGWCWQEKQVLALECVSDL
jgi:hypothetical protein